jgi:membrane peptidoglycan carboxypeptidase
VPSHDETSPVGPRAGSVRRPPHARSRAGTGGGTGSGARRPAGGGRARTTASRSGAGGPAGSGGGPGSGGGSGGGRPPGGRPPGSRPPGGSGKGSGRGRGPKGARTKKQRRRRRIKIALGAIAGLVVLLGVFVGVVYASVSVPDPATVQASQSSTIFYADGTTPMAKLGTENRTNVTLAQVSKPARYAILAAENRSFYSDPGISFTGIVRAAWNDVRGSSTQGGSTITQQYVKKAILQNSSQTFTRKFKELFLAIKLDNNYSKTEILQNYLNTIYFGRGAYGIEAAANTYFGVHASELTAQQGAVLAVLVRSPSYYDPAAHPKEAQDRWGRVLDGMVQEHWLSAADRKASTYPPVQPNSGSTLGMPTGPEGLIVGQVTKELAAKGYTQQQIHAGGLRITSTVDKGAQDAAITAVSSVMKNQPTDKLRDALVAVDPKTGAVLAYYGGPKGSGQGAIDYAQAQRPPGSSMKPYTLATGLEQGISVEAIRNGSSPQEFSDRPGKPVRNAGNEACAACSLKQAITESLNTVFYGEALEVGATKVRKTALAATGLPDTWASGLLAGKKTLADAQAGTTGGAIGIGQYEMRTIDQAVGFATFASGGIHRDPYFVAKVTDSTGKSLLTNAGSAGEQVVPSDVAHDVTYALTGVAAWSHDALAGNRPVASKTGTQGQEGSPINDTDAWMVGYTPSISAAVWMGSDKGNDAIVNALGHPIYGSGLPGQIWKQFMDAFLKGKPVEKLPDSPLIKGDTGHPVNPVATKSAPVPTHAAEPTKAPAPTTTTAAPTTTTPATTSTATSTATTTVGPGSPGPGGPGHGGGGGLPGLPGPGNGGGNG